MAATGVLVAVGGMGVLVRVGVAVGGTGVLVRVGVAVGGTGVLVPVAVALGAIAVFVAVGGTGVFVRVGVAVAGTGVLVAGIGVLVGVGAAPEQARPASSSAAQMSRIPHPNPVSHPCGPLSDAPSYRCCAACDAGTPVDSRSARAPVT